NYARRLFPAPSVLAVDRGVLLVWSSEFKVFFFQAEDGIRDKLVTGVQTCALPISCRTRPGSVNGSSGSDRSPLRTRANCMISSRSEERRVGKECRSRWSA